MVFLYLFLVAAVFLRRYVKIYIKVKRLFLQTILDCTILLYTFLNLCQGAKCGFDKIGFFDTFHLQLLYVFSYKRKISS